MTALPLKTSISDTYPNPSNATARAGFAQLWDVINEVFEKPELDLASATTCDIGGQLSTKLRITGTTTITGFGTNYRGPIQIRMAGALTITHNSTTLRCPWGVSYTTTANELMAAWPISSSSGTADGWQLVSLSGGVLSIAAGGTGAATAAAAFSALKQAATTSATGVVELATDAEAQAGTDATRCVTPDNLGAVVLGLGQSWQNLTASRAVNTTYTNSTGRSIQVSVCVSSSSGGSAAVILINGAINIYGSSGAAPGEFLYVSAIIPAGATYRVGVTVGSASIVSNGWTELR
ncbi:hypothetical protein SAMN05216404_106142 [Nitrosospira multiformis]|uniref:Uncharacterized protein n=1 Tax=Nitrosospira multiformis TaxID=1231 RepID=A0A1H8IPH6_9PROT|nr:hypothetical protein [Nitrosospira multiformis]SEN70593.1 hypothetical protein SAMN05216404_106142 [Nitrosospira multiformis]